MSIVKDGEWEGMPLHRLWEEHRQEIFGPGYERFPRFPLLCKILDARENLSVQVHPPERTAAARQGEVKNEIWYVPVSYTHLVELEEGVERIYRWYLSRMEADGN